MASNGHERREDARHFDPLARLPYEIGIQCLIFAIGDEWESSSGPLPYIMVSLDWKRMIIESPSLWTNIVVYNGEDEEARVATFVHLSRGLPLTVKMLVSFDYKPSLNLLWDHRSRLRSLAVAWSVISPIDIIIQDNYDEVTPPLNALVDERTTWVLKTVAYQMGIQIVDTRQGSLGIALEHEKKGEDYVVFKILDKVVTKYRLNPISFSIPLTPVKIYRAVRAVAHCYRFLHLAGDGILQNKIKIEMTKLRGDDEYDDNLNLIMKPDGPNLIHDGVINLVADGKTVYGVTIKNTLNRPLYASVFFIEKSRSTITPFFQPGAAVDKEDTYIPPKGLLPIGYGSGLGGHTQWKYYLREGQEIDVGFIKIFLSTDPVDFSSIPQASPFGNQRRGTSLVDFEPLGLCETVILTVVQHRSLPS